MQNAGRSRILEALTQSERTLLANVRQLERFKRGFYLQIAIGRTPGAGPNFTGNFLATPGSGGVNAGGFLGLLETQQQIRNQEFNVRQLETVLNQFVQYAEAGLLSQVQLKLFEATFYAQQRVLLDAKTDYQTSLDNFKALLGLPPTLDVVIDDGFLDRFNLVSDEINDRLISIGNLRQDAGDQLSIIDSQIASFQESGFQWPDGLEEQLVGLVPAIEEAQKTIKAIRDEDFAQLNQDFDLLRQRRVDRTKYLRKLTEDVAEGRIISSVSADVFAPKTIPDPADLQAFLSKPEKKVDDDETLELPSILTRLNTLEAQLQETQDLLTGFVDVREKLEGESLYDYLALRVQKAIPGQLSELNNISLDLSLLQAEARANSIEIVNTEIASEHAIRIARCLRRDWMNARASLVDQYRNIEFVADQLEAGLDLEFSGSIGNDGNNPFAIRSENGQLQAGLRFDAPIVRLAERNDYRSALIDYQQTKRAFYQFEDSIKGDLRELVRNAGRNRVRFELDRRSVQVAIQNVEVNRLELERPIGANNTSLATTTARNLTEAIIGLSSAQNSYLSTWVQYEVLRRNLDFDMGTMQLDSLDQWIDPGQIDDQIGVRALASMGVQPDCQFCENIGIAYEQRAPVAPEEEQIENPFSSSIDLEEDVNDSFRGQPNPDEPAAQDTPSPENPTDLGSPNLKPATPPESADPTLQPRLNTPEIPELPDATPELLNPTVPTPEIKVPVPSVPTTRKNRFQQIKVKPIDLPTPQPIPESISKPISSAAAQPTIQTTQAKTLQPLRPNPSSLSSLKPAAKPDGIASWPIMPPLRSTAAVGLTSVELTDAEVAGFARMQGSTNIDPKSGDISHDRANQPTSEPLATKNQLNPIATPSEKPQPERFFYTLPPLNTSAGSTFSAPLAEKQQE